MMAQILKKNSYEAIITAAREEFLKNGYDDASMRNIAQKTGMTVGNLYRYFDSKDALFEKVCCDTQEKISAVLNNLKSESLQMETRVFALKADISDLIRMMDEFAEEIFRIYQENRPEFLIILNDERYTEKLRNWFSKGIESLIFQHLLNHEDKENGYLLLKAHVDSLLQGLRTIFAHDDESVVHSVLKSYLELYIIMLDNTIGKRVN